MGEVNLCSDQGREVVLQDEEEEREILKETKEGSTTGIKCERSLPRMILRVLLVEADDSTRQIITALLRKCSYRVTAVPDGLKAWEALKGRPHNIDLILTEMELPLISGLALLTLIMEHEICKNIPVIMMSSHDSINLVFKCMLRGAADFFIKPIRKNELRNLWQHVWRRQSSAGSGQGFHDKTLAQRKVEAISENNAASYHSSDYVACTQKNKECSEKGSDAQSSCTKPDMEAESARMQNVQDHFQPKCWSSLVSDRKIQKHKEHVRLDQELLMHEGEGEDKSLNLRSEGASWNEANDSARLIPGEDHAYGKIMTHCEDVSPEGHREDANIYSGNYEQAGPSREAIDLIGAFDNRPRCIYRHADKTAIQEVLSTDSKIRFVSNSKLGSTPLLDLSLKRSHPSDFESQGTEERHTLNHSNASAFSWYINRTVQPLLPTPASLCTGPEETKKCHKHMPNQDPGNTADAPPHNGTDLLNQESVQDETVLPCRWLRVVPVPVPVSGIRFDDLCASYGTVLPPMFASQSGQLSLWGQNSDSQPEPTFHLNSSHNSNPETRYSEVHHLHDQNADNFTNQTVHEQMEHNLESVEDPRDVSPVNGQSVNSNLCNGAISQLNSSWCGSVCNGSSGKENVTPSAATRATAESGNVEGLIVRDGIRGMGPHCSTQREAALTKFRMKRKDRSYEKKVRYQNRKRLAEQRPRVKGQFVRQIRPDHPSAESDCYH